MNWFLFLDSSIRLVNMRFWQVSKKYHLVSPFHCVDQNRVEIVRQGWETQKTVRISVRKMVSWNLSFVIVSWILWYWLYGSWPQVCGSVRLASADVALRTNLWALHDVWSPGTQLAFNGKKSENGKISDFISEYWVVLTASQVSFFTHKLLLQLKLIRSPEIRESNSHTRPMSRRFHLLVYF